jgi:hypothetical protein
VGFGLRVRPLMLCDRLVSRGDFPFLRISRFLWGFRPLTVLGPISGRTGSTRGIFDRVCGKRGVGAGQVPMAAHDVRLHLPEERVPVLTYFSVGMGLSSLRCHAADARSTPGARVHLGAPARLGEESSVEV